MTLRRAPLKRGTKPLQRRTQLRPVSKKRRKEAPARRAVREATFERAGYQCEARDLVPEVACAGPLDADERVSRGVRPGAHLDVSLTQALCRAHHDWRHREPAEARRRGLRLTSGDAAA